MSTYEKSPRIGDEAPPPDDGVGYTVIEVDEEKETVHLEWRSMGKRYRCWVPMSAVNVPPKH